MQSLKIPHEYTNWIYKSLINRNITFQNGIHKVQEITSNSIPQGDPLSPDLFNIYTSKLHNISNDKAKILQYADDFIIITAAKDRKETEKLANETLNKFNEQLKEINLNLNQIKTAYMNINNKRNETPSKIKINNIEIQEVNQIKTLGYIIDKKLNFKQHHKNLKNCCINAVNIIKIFARKKGGAHPSTLLNLQKSLIESRIRYSAILSTSKHNIETIQKIINTGLRICLGLTNSTPVTAIISEAGDLPVDMKIDMFNYSYAAKHIYNNTLIGQKIRNNNLNKTLNEIYAKYKNQLDKLPTKDIEDQNIINHNNLEIDFRLRENLEKKNNYNKVLIKQVTLEYIREQGGKAISYTDGSIVQNKRGIGIFNQYNNDSYSYNIEEPLCIKSIEALAILEAIRIAIKNNIREITIITDSLSTCVSLENYRKNNKLKYMESQIYNITNSSNIKVKIIWIPSHIEIEGNDEADKAAKQGTITRRKIETSTPIEDNIKIFKNEMYNKWNIEFLERTTLKGTQHRKNINEIVTMRPWFHKKNLDSGMIKRMTRIRTNHTYDKKYLKLIKKIEDDQCETCNTKEDARHIIEECKKYDSIREKYKNIKNKKLQDILANNQINQYCEVNDFLKEIKADI